MNAIRKDHIQEAHLSQGTEAEEVSGHDREVLGDVSGLKTGSSEKPIVTSELAVEITLGARGLSSPLKVICIMRGTDPAHRFRKNDIYSLRRRK